MLNVIFYFFSETCDNQFGFKKGSSPVTAMFALKSTINYFTSRGSIVFVSFLDMSRAFDGISHYGLFLKLMKSAFMFLISCNLLVHEHVRYMQME